MPPSKHAVLSASGAHRWLHCNPSARLELEFADRETEAAAEGTAAHALAEHKLKKALKLRSRKPVSPYDCDEMDAYTDGYVEFVLEQLEEAKALCADPLVLIEQRLDFSCYVPDGFGTGDCLIVADKLLHIIDFKYGQGVLVDTEENPQMMLYALGALRQFDHLYDIAQVAMSIYQPRRENVSTWTISVEQLMEWAEHTLKPKAEMAYQGEGDYDSLSSEVAGQLVLLTALLSNESLSENDWNCICLIGTYIKRFCNLRLTYQEQQTIPMGDLALSLQDMAKCMKNIGIRTSLDFCPISNLGPELILLITKTLEEILEEADFRLTSVAIQISDTVCFEITGTDHEFVSRSLEGGYSLQTEKIPAGYWLLLLKEGEVGQS